MMKMQENRLQLKLISDMEKVLPAKEPSGEGAATRMTVLKGETISFQAAYYGDVERKQRGVIRVSAPAGIHVNVKTVGLVPCAYPCHRQTDDGYLVTEPGLYPDILEAVTEFGFPIIAGQWRSLWVDIETSEDTPAGEYPVKLVLESKAHAPGMKDLSRK